MGMTKTTEALKTDIIEAAARGGWVRISELEGTGTEEMRKALEELAQDGVIEIEPEPMGWRITEADRAAAVVIGGEPRHLIRMI